MLPFEVVGNEEYFELTPQIRVQQYDCLTVCEAIALEQLLTPDLQALLKESGIQIEALIHLRSVLAAVLLISRYEPATTLGDVAALPLDTIVAASDFLLREKDGSKPKKATEDDGQKLDWAALWWKLQRHYPHESRFRAEGFGNCPIVLVEQALASLEEEQLQRLSAEAVAISRHGYYLSGLQAKKPIEPEHFNPWQQILDKRQAKAEIPEQAAKLFLDLCAEKKVPAWVVATVDIEKLRRAADG